MANKKKNNTHLVNIEQIAQTFKQNEHLYERLREESLFTLREEIGNTEIKIHSIPSRIKTLDSFQKKVNLYRIEEPFKTINDIIGLRVICLFLTDIEKIGDIIEKTFELIKKDDKIDNSKFASFGYLSVHYIVKLGKEFSGTRYNNISDIPFEVQVRTIAMDAWANISHYLEYKTDKDIPEELKRDFYALSGMFYVADKHFQMFFEQRQEKTEEIAQVFEKGQQENINSQPINLDTLKAFMREKFSDYEASDDISDLVENATNAGLKTIGEINSLVEKNKAGAEKFIIKVGGLKLEDVSDFMLCRTVLYLSSYDFFRAFMSRNVPDKVDKILSEEVWLSNFSEYRNLL